MEGKTMGGEQRLEQSGEYRFEDQQDEQNHPNVAGQIKKNDLSGEAAKYWDPATPAGTEERIVEMMNRIQEKKHARQEDREASQEDRGTSPLQTGSEGWTEQEKNQAFQPKDRMGGVQAETNLSTERPDPLVDLEFEGRETVQQIVEEIPQDGGKSQGSDGLLEEAKTQTISFGSEGQGQTIGFSDGVAEGVTQHTFIEGDPATGTRPKLVIVAGQDNELGRLAADVAAGNEEATGNLLDAARATAAKAMNQMSKAVNDTVSGMRAGGKDAHLDIVDLGKEGPQAVIDVNKENDKFNKQ
jgi:hypothetical protein